ncbi:MAG: twin-arginine translocase subunit TatC [Acidobacteriota bacterium]
MKRKKSPNEMSFLEHLGELRKRIIYSVSFLVIMFFASWGFSKEIYKFLAKPLTRFLPTGEKLAFTSIVDPFMMYLKVSFLAAIFFSSPFIFLQLWLFVAPGLYEKEKRYVLPFVFFTSFFFLSGGAFGYFIVFPWACNFFLKLGADFRPVITIDQYFSLVIKVLLGIGLVFELPILIFFLSRLGIVNHKFLINKIGYAVLIIFIISALITPTADMITQTILAGPMIALYLVGVLIAYIFEKKEKENLKG